MRNRVWILALCGGLAVGPARAELLPGKSASDLVSEGNEHFKKGDLEEALKRYLAAQSQHPNAPELHFNIGDVEFGKGKFDNAALEFRRVVQNSDRRLLPQAAYNLGTAMAQDKKTAKAIELYKAAIKLDPNDVEARHNLGVLLEQQQKQQQQGGQDQKQQPDQKDQKDQKQQQDQKDQKQGQSGQKPEDKKPDDKKQGQQPPKPQEPKPGEQQPQAAQGEKSDKPPEQKGEQIQGAIPREQAERLLDLLKDEEKQGMFIHQAPKPPEEADPEKDW